MPHPGVQRRGHAPEEHARRHPRDHAISPAQGGARGLQRDEEGEEEGHGRVEVALLEPNVGREVCRLGISYLRAHCACQLRCALSNAAGTRSTPTYIRLVQRVEQEQERQEGQQQAVELQDRPPVQPRVHRVRFCFLLGRHGAWWSR
jgi:hypothetical protein